MADAWRTDYIITISKASLCLFVCALLNVAPLSSTSLWGLLSVSRMGFDVCDCAVQQGVLLHFYDKSLGSLVYTYSSLMMARG